MLPGRKSFEGWVAALAESVLRDRSTDRAAWLDAPRTDAAGRRPGRLRRRRGAGPDEPAPRRS